MNLHYDAKRDSWRILYSEEGKRKQIFLGRIAELQAAEVLRHCRLLLAYKMHGGVLGGETVQWCQQIDSELRNKLTRVALVDLIVAIGHIHVPTLWHRFTMERAANWRPATSRSWAQAGVHAYGFFGEQPAKDIKPSQAPAYHAWLRKHQGLNSASTRKTYDQTRSVFAWAVKRKLIPENPLGDYLPSVNHNQARHRYIDKETIDAVAEFCDPQARLVLYLARYAGLRINSESELLQWRFVDQKPGYLFVRTRKLETVARHKADRHCPIFSKLREEIERYRKHAEQFGTVHPDQLMLSRRLHLRQVTKAIQQAGLKQWPKLFVNLRASCITDMGDAYSENRIAKWLGTSIEIVKRYLVERGELDTKIDPFHPAT